jgi:hypothetical protein
MRGSKWRKLEGIGILTMQEERKVEEAILRMKLEETAREEKRRATIAAPETIETAANGAASDFAESAYISAGFKKRADGTWEPPPVPERRLCS